MALTLRTMNELDYKTYPFVRIGLNSIAIHEHPKYAKLMLSKPYLLHT